MTSRGAGGDDTVENLMPLCAKHHEEIHKSIGKMCIKYPEVKVWLVEMDRTDILRRLQYAVSSI